MSETDQSSEDIQNQFLSQHGINLETFKEMGWEFRFFICPSINEKTEYTKSLEAQYGNGNVRIEPLIGNDRSYQQSGGVSGWAFFVRPK